MTTTVAVTANRPDWVKRIFIARLANGFQKERKVCGKSGHQRPEDDEQGRVEKSWVPDYAVQPDPNQHLAQHQIDAERSHGPDREGRNKHPVDIQFSDHRAPSEGD